MQLLFVCILVVALSVCGAAVGQRRATCGHFTPEADSHPRCEPCRLRSGECGGPSQPCSVCVDWSPEQRQRAAVGRPSASRRGRQGRDRSVHSSGGSWQLTSTPPVIDRSVGSPRPPDRVQISPLPVVLSDRVTTPQPSMPVMPGSADEVPRRPVNERGLRKQFRTAARKLKEASKRSRAAEARVKTADPAASTHRSPGGGTGPSGSAPGDDCPASATGSTHSAREGSRRVDTTPFRQPPRLSPVTLTGEVADPWSQV